MPPGMLLLIVGQSLMSLFDGPSNVETIGLPSTYTTIRRLSIAFIK